MFHSRTLTQLSLTLKTAEVKYDFGYGLNNTPVPSSGCGKTLTFPKSGEFTMMNQGKTRTIKIYIPDNYDNNKPYRLVFGMHCMGGWAQGGVDEGYYGLKPLDTQNSIIFVAPQGYVWDSNVPWSEQDFPFFDSLLVNLESNLCIDSSRVFSTGFSYGSMYTNSLAQNHQKVLRGVAVYETAGYNIYIPDNTGEPFAWMGVVGMHATNSLRIIPTMALPFRKPHRKLQQAAVVTFATITSK